MDFEQKKLHINNQFIRLTKEDGYILMCLSRKGKEVRLAYCNDMDPRLPQSYKIANGKISLKFLEEEIRTRAEADDRFKMAFTLVVIDTP